MIDGTVAGKTNTVSKFGERLDTIADLIFVTVCFIKLIPVLDIPLWLCHCAYQDRQYHFRLRDSKKIYHSPYDNE